MKEPILTASEKEYLSNVIKPFRGKSAITIGKYSWAYGNDKEYVAIIVTYADRADRQYIIGFPYFNSGEMYRGMEVDKEYAPEDLGL